MKNYNDGSGPIAIITARGGSKRIKNKNIKEFCGKPIIYYSITAAIESKIFSEVMVSTDDKTIAAVAASFGAAVPFMRSARNSSDTATLSEAADEIIKKYEASGRNFNYACLILPTAPFINAEIITSAYSKITEGCFDSLFPVVKFAYPIYRSLKFENGKIAMIWPENIDKRSQDFEPAFHDAGQFYWININSFKKQKKIFMKNSTAIELPEIKVQDIDCETDWKIAELKYKALIE